jgi:hypothetical protein
MQIHILLSIIQAIKVMAGVLVVLMVLVVLGAEKMNIDILFDSMISKILLIVWFLGVILL